MKLCVFAVLATAAAFCGNPSCSGCPGCQGLAVAKTATKAVGAAALGTSAVHKSNVAALPWLNRDLHAIDATPARRRDLRAGTALVFSSTPAALAAPGDSIKRTAPVERQEYADESGLKKYSYSNMPWEDLDKSTAKFAPKTNWNTLYPEKRLRLEKKSPVARRDLAPAGNFATYAKTYPGLYSAVSGLPMGQVPELMMKPSESKKPVYPNGFYKAPPKKPVNAKKAAPVKKK